MAKSGHRVKFPMVCLIGERIEQLRQAFNLREGLNPKKDFRLHPRLYGDPPASQGPAKETTLKVEALTNGFYQALAGIRRPPDPTRIV